jgi:predicted aminopeptidase
MQAASGQASVMSKRQPIAKVVADPNTPPKVRGQLEQVLAIREFAVKALALPDNGSYRSYADVGRSYVVWNVFAAPEFSVEPKQWCFPVAGCVAYRGYFDETKAKGFAARLAKEGYDVFVGGVAAYSTLGHFDDPVLNTMMGWSDVQLAAIIFHELSHQLVYVAGDSSFNEGFASLVEEEGVRRWLVSAGRERELEAFERQRQRYLDFAELLTNAREQLRQTYAGTEPAERKRELKAAQFADLRSAYEKLKGSWNGVGSFDSWFQEGINNAHLASIATYRDCVPGLERLLKDANGDLPTFYASVREVSKLKPDQRKQRVCTTNTPRQTALPPSEMAIRIELPGSRRLAEILVHDAEHRVRLDAERLEAVLRTHAVDAERAEVVEGEWLPRHQAEHEALQPADEIRQRNDAPPEAQRRRRDLDDLAQREDLRATELERLADDFLRADAAGERLDHIADIDGRQARLGARQWKEIRQQSRDPCKAVDEGVTATENDGRPEDHELQPARFATDDLFGQALAAQVVARA